MSFATEFTARWEQVIQPALGRIQYNDVPLIAHRVDLSKSGDAILTEILQSIADSIVIVAGVSAIGSLNGRAVRNANVLYEVGIAHASRRPEEVVLFRSDSLPLDFDVQGVRVHTYDPDGDPKGAQNTVVETVIESLRGAASSRRVAIRLAAQRLTSHAYWLLLEGLNAGVVRPSAGQTIGQLLSGVRRESGLELLLELGAIEARFMKISSQILDQAEREPKATADFVDYVPTVFGRALAEYVAEQMAPADSTDLERIESFLRNQGGEAPG